MKRNKDVEINKLMVTLGISKQEATELWEFDNSIKDNGKTGNAEVDSLTEKAKSVKNYVSKGKRAPNKKPEKPIDTVKIDLVKKIYGLMQDYTEVSGLNIVNPTKEVSFNIGSENFSLTIVRHRNKKNN